MKERAWGTIGLAAGASLLGAWLLLATCFDAPWRHALLTGWLVILLNGLLAHGLYAWALRQRSEEKFLIISLGGSILRSAVLLAVVIVIRRQAVLAFMPFLTTVLTGYFIFLFVEIGQLHLHAEKRACPAS